MKNHLASGDTFTVGEHSFRVTFEPDDSHGYPWENSDGHGPVRKSKYRFTDGSDKRHGERLLNDAGRHECQFYYDWHTAMQIAKREGWNVEPFDAPGQVLRAVTADFDYLRAFLMGDWCYVGVSVEMLVDGKATQTDSLWGVETYKDYHVDTAYEIANELIANHDAAALQVKIDNRFADAMACGV